MNYAIEFFSSHYDHLHSTSRKRTLKHVWLRVRSGLALIKLGKTEFAVEPNQLFWLPQDCLSAVTFLPNSHIDQCHFSVRLNDRFSHQAGFVTSTPLVSALFDTLVDFQECDANMPNDKAEARHELLVVLKRQATQITPLLTENSLTQHLTQWQAKLLKGVLPQTDQPQTDKDSALSQELKLALLVREAQKRRLSGQAHDVIVEQLFDNNESQYQQATSLVLGEPLR
ncbi:AraC family transcriptional regulator [Vibrio sp. SM6]|uniref:AraC family transcriptional regulator n=1 Tax=Vibrio agarilyticus TaxID=2726741 RepID=A0A7X8YFI9_9VIBR|nr:AraC family transcriptional regulator [Vibrio agarilyticus]NLS11709.1 AraC family transcriptional regulator [Vibrio agarilyticus]